MIIWQGRGGYVPLIVFLTSLFGNIIFDYVNKGYYDNHHWVPGVFITLSALFVFMLNKNTDQRERSLVDQQTGEQLTYKPSHTLFWIPLQYWAPIITVCGIALIFGDLSR